MFTASSLIDAAEAQTGLTDFGGETFRFGLSTLVTSLTESGDLSETGEAIMGMRLEGLLANRLRIEETYRTTPAIGDEQIEGPVFIVGLPRTGTTALSEMVALDPQIRSLRTWESSAPVPPPTTETEHTDPRIAATAAGMEMMISAFPRMPSLHLMSATGPTECQDLLGMEFATAHFDGMAHVPGYTSWVLGADMVPAYRYHRRVLQLLQSQCPPRLWHLKTPVHLFSLDALVSVYPEARFVWTHRDPAKVIGSVCDLISYTRSWVSDRDERAELGPQQCGLWAEALHRGIDFRDRVGEERFADIGFGELNADPVGAITQAFSRIGLSVTPAGASRMSAWASANAKGAHGAHDYDLASFGLEERDVRNRFAFYTDRFDLRT